MFRQNMEAYMDDMLVKSFKGKIHANHLLEAFKCMRCHEERIQKFSGGNNKIVEIEKFMRKQL